MTGAYLLDVNVLIALVDPAHVQHEAAHAWFASVGHRSWATCAITQNVSRREFLDFALTQAAQAPRDA